MVLRPIIAIILIISTSAYYLLLQAFPYISFTVLWPEQIISYIWTTQSLKHIPKLQSKTIDHLGHHAPPNLRTCYPDPIRTSRAIAYHPIDSATISSEFLRYYHRALMPHHLHFCWNRRSSGSLECKMLPGWATIFRVGFVATVHSARGPMSSTERWWCTTTYCVPRSGSSWHLPSMHIHWSVQSSRVWQVPLREEMVMMEMKREWCW